MDVVSPRLTVDVILERDESCAGVFVFLTVAFSSPCVCELDDSEDCLCVCVCVCFYLAISLFVCAFFASLHL